MSKLPLVLLAGFLGAGKTTLLRATLQNLKARGFPSAVILNDYTNARMDAQRLSDLAASMTPITGSCVCCGSREELFQALREARPGEKGAVLVETNGTSDTLDLVETLTATKEIVERFHPIWLVTVIDAKRWQRRIWHNQLEKIQARTATHLHISRRDMVKPERLDQVTGTLRDLNPHATMIDAAQLADIIERAEAPGVVFEKTSHCCEEHGCRHGEGHHHEHDHHHDHHALSHGFASRAFDFPEVVNREHLEAWLQGLPEAVLRVKGTVRFDPSSSQYTFFEVAAPGSKPVYEKLPAAEWLKPTGFFVACGLSEEEVERLLPSSQALGS